MIKHRCIPLDSPAEWKEALSGIKHSFSQTWENCYAMHLTTAYKTYLYCFEKEDLRIICPVSERTYGGFTDIVTPYGFSGFTGTEDFTEFPFYWEEFVKEKKYVCGYISLNPLLENKTYYKEEDSFSATNLYFINLDLSLTELYVNLDSNRKKQIKDFRKAETTFTYDKKILTAFFTGNYYNFLKRIGASAANYFVMETLEYICNLENVYMVGAGNGEEINSLYIFGCTNYIGDCLFNISTEDGKKNAPLLLWSGLKFFRSKKIPVMNLGGGIKNDDNVALSKQRFGAFSVPFINLKQVYDLEVYKKLCMEKNVSPDSTGYFPAYRK